MNDDPKLIGALAGILLLINIIIFIGMVCLTYHLMTMIGLTGYGGIFASIACTLTWFHVYLSLEYL